jgi:aminodeoxyfutalosine deaminase
MILRARLVLPLSGPPIPNGAVVVSHGRVVSVGRWAHESPGASQPAFDLGEVVLLPGLINAHCHLDYTHMAGHFPPPKSFAEWLQTITESKAGWNLQDYSSSWRSGADMLLRTGTTTVVDIEAMPQLLPAAWEWTPLRVFSLLEMIGITNRRPPQRVLAETLTTLVSLKHTRCRAGLSPHAPYSTLPELLCLTAQAARKHRSLVCTHLAESAIEREMFQHARGVMFSWLQRSGRDMSDCGRGSPVQHLERCGLLRSKLLAAHVNYLSRGDAMVLARRGVSVVHCPRSHAYFQHGPFPRVKLHRAGINLCLGTDSLASVYQKRRQTVALDMFEEMRTLADRDRGLSPRSILRLATLNGALALGYQGRLGEITPGAFADLIALPIPTQTRSIFQTILEHRGSVAASMVHGQWAIPPVGSEPSP